MTTETDSSISPSFFQRAALHRWHWVCILVGMIPMLFADIYFLYGWADLPDIRTNKIAFYPALGYVFVALAIYCVVFIDGRNHLLRLVPALHLLIGAILAFSEPSTNQVVLIYLYLFTCLVSLTFFLILGRVGSPRFISFGCVLLLLPFVVPFLTFARVALAILLILLLRLTIVFVGQNIGFFKRLGLARSLVVLLKTTVYWVPLAALIVGISWIGSLSSRWVEKQLYEQGIVESCASDSKGEMTLRSNIDCTIDAEAQRLGNSLRTQYDIAASSVQGTIAQYPAQVRDFMEKSIEERPAAFEPKRGCKVYQVGCHIANAIKKAALRSYQAARRSAIDRVYSDALESSKRANATRASIDATVRDRLPSLISSTNHILRQTTKSAFNVLDIVNVLGNVLLALSAVKSFLYIYSRLAFAAAPDIFLSSATIRRPAPPIGSIKDSDTGFDIRPKPGATFYKAHSVPAGNFPQRVSVPQPFSAVIGRLASWRYVMDRSPTDINPASSFPFVARDGRHLVRWTLSDGETISLRLKHLIMLQSTVKISTKISLRLSTLLLGRMIFPVLRGPGIVLLYTSGPASIETNTVVKPAGYEAERFVAWREETGFDVIAASGFLDVYFSSVQVRASGPISAAVIDPTGTHRFTGAARFITTFLLPW